MTLTLDIPKEIEVRLTAEAQAHGVPLSEFVSDFIVDYYQEAEESRIAEARLDDPKPPISPSTLQKNPWLGQLNTTPG